MYTSFYFKAVCNFLMMYRFQLHLCRIIIHHTRIWRRSLSWGIWKTSSSEFVVTSDIEILKLHQALLLCAKPALEEAFKWRFFWGLEEEGIASNKIPWGDIEANWLHDIPSELPEGEPHECSCLSHKEAQSAPELSSCQCFGSFVNSSFLHLHFFKLFSHGIIWNDWW